MGYIHCDGKIYGIIPFRASCLESIILNLPLINLLYTKKIRIDITNRLKSGAPCSGIFNEFRVYKNDNAFRILFMVPKTFTNVLLSATDINEPCNNYSKEFDKEDVFYPCVEYSEVILL